LLSLFFGSIFTIAKNKESKELERHPCVMPILRPISRRRMITTKKMVRMFFVQYRSLLTKALCLIIGSYFLLQGLVFITYQPTTEGTVQSVHERDCLWKRGFPPLKVSPNRVLDEIEMDYGNPPFSSNRSVYSYELLKDDFQPVVTVITSFYNSWLFTAPEAVLQQSLQQIEWIIVNDASTNFTQLLEPYRNHPRVQIIDLKQHVGASEARNVAITIARAPYVFFLDADDTIEPTYLEKAYWFLETHPQFTMVNSWTVQYGAWNDVWKKGDFFSDFNEISPSNFTGNNIKFKEKFSVVLV
jgi:hypothetical protein